MKNFRTFTLAVEFYKRSKTLPVSGNLKDQLNRASSSIALNLAEARGRVTLKDQKRFFHIAFGSLREVQAIMLIVSLEHTEEFQLLDKLAAHLYRLIQNAK